MLLLVSISNFSVVMIRHCNQEIYRRKNLFGLTIPEHQSASRGRIEGDDSSGTCFEIVSRQNNGPET